MNYAASRFASVIAAAALTVAAGCSAHSGTALPPMASNAAPEPMPRAASSAVSVLNKLRKQIVIGSTVDPKFGQLNPYGLTVAPSTNGAFAAGDLAVCNFNAKRNVQGTGFTIVALHPKAGSTPRLVAAGRELTGCNSLALAPDDTIWAAAFSADDNPVIAANGKLLTNVKGTAFDRPWGQAFAVPKHGAPAFYESNTGDGTILRIGLGARFTYTTIARGFAVNHGQPGSIFGP
ncbi:MAG: hypothetical protein JO199_04430, partial [Candidatus Eremiobacteraeota bacterium]|nr:hypothetical protein [Candidatus Eremiobacteraeota bacterium]